jgi:hypothetical protein
MAMCLAAGLAAGCRTAAPLVPRPIGNEVLGALSVQAMRETYATPALVVRGAEDGRNVAVQDVDLAAGAHVDDTNLVIFVEGAGDTVDGFRATASLLAESPHAFRGSGPSLAVVLLKWGAGVGAVADHINAAAQEAGAVLLAEMLEVHLRRHGTDGRVSIIGFSAGTHVIQMAFARAAAVEGWHSDAFHRVSHVVTLGSSLGCDEVIAADGIGGRFINFVNPRDTHFGDRAAYVAQPGQVANPIKLLEQATVSRRPGFGASVAGFRSLPTLTDAAQFDAVDMLESLPQAAGVRAAFHKINVPVPQTLVPYNIFGKALPNDDFDDYLNLAPNHYIMVGRGQGGRDTPTFNQYRAPAEEFVREQVASAALHGRLYRFDLVASPQGADPLGLPTLLPVPWAIIRPGPSETPKEAPKEAPKEEAPPAVAPLP